MSASDHSPEQRAELIARLSDSLDGELPAELRAELQAHLAGCPDCRVVLDTLGRTVRLLRDLGDAPPPLPPAIEARLLELVARRLGAQG